MAIPDYPPHQLDDAARPGRGRINAGQLLLALRRHRILCSIDSLSPDGWTARLGEPGNGLYSQKGCFGSREAAADWLLAEAERRGAVVVSGAQSARI
jgi:hypothetical protein